MQNENTLAIVVHGGAGASRQDADGCQAAARAGLAAATNGGDALAAAIAAVVALEDDGRFNAGSGPILCLDGATVEADAAVMDSRGRLGAVACLGRVENPVLVAHAALAAGRRGRGTLRARRGFCRASGARRARSAPQRAAHGATAGRQGRAGPGHRRRRFSAILELSDAVAGRRAACDTVGAVVRDRHGQFTVACSTGGSAPSLPGRVGDTPIIGSGFYAGPHGAVAATGIGEHIVRHLLSCTVYRWIEQGMPLRRALERGIGLFSGDIDVGLIAVSRGEAGSSSRDMPVHVLEHD